MSLFGPTLRAAYTMATHPKFQSALPHDGGSEDVAITHASGTKLNVKAAAVELGADGGAPLVKETGSLAAFFAAVVSAFSGLGVTISPPTGYTCTKVNGT